jgi:tetratricopeptide (TPR) repeat protein
LIDSIQIRRALAGLQDGSGRTVVVAGPAFSGKSELMMQARRRAEELGAIAVELRGSYRDRSVPLAAVEPLSEAYGRARSRSEVGAGSEELDPKGLPFGVPFGYAPPMEATGRRGARGGRRRSTARTILGPTRPRGGSSPSPAEFFDRVAVDMSDDPRLRLTLVVEDAGLFDPESRDYLLALVDRVRLAPVAIFLALDSSLPTAASWEERLSGRGDVDWIRFGRSKADPRETAHLRERFEMLPPSAQRSIGLVALLDGSMSEVLLSRIMNFTTAELADALFPAVDARILRVGNGRVQVVHDPWVAPVLELFPAHTRRELEHDIAQALDALSPEPTMTRRLEIANHFYAWRHGVEALRAYGEAADLGERALNFDVAEGALEKALACLNDLAIHDRPNTENELKIRRGRALLLAGLPAEGEQSFREGVEGALAAGLPVERLEEMLLETLTALRLVGPRPSLLESLRRLSELAHDRGAPTIQAMFGWLLSSLELDRNHPSEAQDTAARAVRMARGHPSSVSMGLALLAVASARVDSTRPERTIALQFLDRAQQTLSQSHRNDLLSLTDEVHARLLNAIGDRAGALRLHDRSLPSARRLHPVPLELYHHLGIAEICLDSQPVPRVGEELRKARALVEQLRLVPPSLPLLRLWLLEGRWWATGERRSDARERFRAALAQANRHGLPSLRVEALLRLAELDLGRVEDRELAQYLRPLAREDLASTMTPRQAERLRTLLQSVPESGAAAESPAEVAVEAAGSEPVGKEAGEEGVDDGPDADRG